MVGVGGSIPLAPTIFDRCGVDNRMIRIVLATSFLLLAACESETPAVSGDGSAEAPAATAAPAQDVTPELPSGPITELTAIDVRIGDGEVAEPGAVADVHYTGWLYDEQAEDR